ncbi:hypothetical protein [Streptomyces sp. CC228A]|uniref:hypothetical protein n=1 Tax=Streptomyces sp. CC228A TaxID=2898186 RepID=UPI001F212B28|nr:hypothetical protein [Streptomyces sp. CC228A]
MNSTTTLPLFGEDTQNTEAGPQTQVRLGMAAAAARLVTYEDSQHADGQPQALLVVACPFCDHQHIHPAGLASAPRVCPRRSRCVGRPTGVYYFPAVHP